MFVSTKLGTVVQLMTCPGAETGSPTPYTATATQFITYTNGSGGTRAAVLTRQ
jgi:hypothetical protein